MGKLIKIYDNGQVYEIDSDLIYLPWFVGDRLRSIEQVKVDTVYKEENENDTLHS